MEDELLDIIRQVEEKKRDKGIIPCHALFVSDIMPEMKKRIQVVLNKMVKNGDVTWSPTINDNGFSLAKDEKEG